MAMKTMKEKETLYLQEKAKNPEMFLLFKVGDRYEVYGEESEKVAAKLGYRPFEWGGVKYIAFGKPTLDILNDFLQHEALLHGFRVIETNE